jgi:Tc5 transposase DNA-binding domain
METVELKKKVKSYSLEFKVGVLESLNNGETVHTLSLKHNIPEQTIRTWIRNRKTIIEAASQCNSSHKNARKSDFVRLEKILFAWIVDQRKLNAALTADVIRGEAKTIHASLSEEEALPPFRATPGWFRRFKQRYGIKILPLEGSSETFYEISDKPTKDDSLIDEFKFETQDSDVTPSDVEEEDFEVPASSPPQKKFKRSTNRNDEESTTIAKDADLDNILKRLEIESKKIEIKNLNLDFERKKQKLYHRKLMIQHTKLLIKKAQSELDDMDNYFEDDPLTDE